jgi:hypothetical protein
MAFNPAPTAATHPTLADIITATDPDGSIAAVAELLSQTNDILTDMVWVEGNQVTGHKTTIRTGLPSATWRKFNYGVTPGKSRRATVEDSIGMLEAYAEVDKDLAMLNGNTAEFRLSEDRAYIESMNQDMATTLIYGDTATHPERFLGMAARYDTVGDVTSPTANSYGNHIIDAGGSTSSASTSMWLIVWGPNTVHGIYPKGSLVGLQSQDLGEQTLFDENGGRFQGYRTHYQWKCGLTVRDWRYVVRIASIDITKMVATSSDDGFPAVKFMIQAINAIPTLGMGRPVFYCNRSVKTILDIQALNAISPFKVDKDVFGRPVTSFWGIPIRQCDAILNTESDL